VIRVQILERVKVKGVLCQPYDVVRLTADEVRRLRCEYRVLGDADEDDPPVRFLDDDPRFEAACRTFGIDPRAHRRGVTTRRI
jgi:hypothetical protein